MIDFKFFAKLATFKNQLEYNRQEQRIKLYLRLRLLYYLKFPLMKQLQEKNEKLCNWDFTLEKYGIDLDKYSQADKEKLRLDLIIAKHRIKSKKYKKRDDYIMDEKDEKLIDRKEMSINVNDDNAKNRNTKKQNTSEDKRNNTQSKNKSMNELIRESLNTDNKININDIIKKHVDRSNNNE